MPVNEAEVTSRPLWRCTCGKINLGAVVACTHCGAAQPRKDTAR